MRLDFRLAVLLAGQLLLWGTPVSAEITVHFQRNDSASATADYRFSDIPQPSRNDAGSQATFALVDGSPDRNGGDLQKLNDGFLPTEDDEPRENFFFRAGSDGGRLLVDLGRSIEIKQINSYSWHPADRGPQVYRLYASTGAASEFDPQPKRDIDPVSCGWELLASVDTRSDQGRPGGQYGVSVSNSEGLVGTYRYVLFDIFRTEAEDAFGNTFFSEIDIVDAVTPPEVVAPRERPGRRVFEIADGRYRLIVDTSETPDLQAWVEGELVPVLVQWYPKIVALLPSDGYEAPQRVTINFRQGMRGVAATGGTSVQCAASWFRENLRGEAKGAVVHELVHVVQQYGRVSRSSRNATRPPGWLVEGIADYIRWFLYEPETRGAEISGRDLSRVRYDASYRVSANFLNWVTQKYDPGLVSALNAAAREGRYSESMWKDRTGHTLEELGQEWKAGLAATSDADP